MFGMRRIRSVTAAQNDRATKGSRASCPPLDSHLALGAGWSGEADAVETASLGGLAEPLQSVPRDQLRVIGVGNKGVRHREPHDGTLSRSHAVGPRVQLTRPVPARDEAGPAPWRGPGAQRMT